MTIETQEKCPDCLRPTNSADGTADPFCLRAWSGGTLGVEVCLKLTVARLRGELAEDEEAMRGLVEFLDGGTRCFHCDEVVPPEEQEHWRNCEKHPAMAALAIERTAREKADAERDEAVAEVRTARAAVDLYWKERDAGQKRIEGLAAILTELLRLYDWRFTLAEREKDQRNASEKDFKAETRRLLNQYGAEKKAAWEAARAALRSAPPGDT